MYRQKIKGNGRHKSFHERWMHHFLDILVLDNALNHHDHIEFMDAKTFFIYFFNILAFVLYIALVGVNIWPIIGLYWTRPDWWGGNTSIKATEYAAGGALVGMVAMSIHLDILRKKMKITHRTTRICQCVGICGGIVLLSACLPYFIIPAQVGENARAEFARTWSVDWETRVHRPANGPWLDSPYSFVQEYLPLSYSKDAFTFQQNIEFFNNGNDSFKCDAWIPVVPGPNPVQIFIHGGGWGGFDKNFIIGYQLEYFAAAGYTVFSVDYGSKGGTGVQGEVNRTRQYSIPEICANLGKFSDWLAQPAQVTAYNMNISRCFITGLSAGGHLSALMGMARTKVGAWNPAVHVRGAIDFYGIMNIRQWAMVSQTSLYNGKLFNSSILTDYSIVDRYSPITYAETPSLAGGDIVPLLIFHGDADTVVSVTQGRDMNDMCDSRLLKCVYIEIPRGAHVFESDNNAGPSQITLWAMERFMQLCAA